MSMSMSDGDDYTLEMATRAKTQLTIVLVDHAYGYYEKYKKLFQDAAHKDLVELVSI